MHLAQELLTNIQSSGGSRSFAKETRPLKMRNVVVAIRSWQWPTERITEADPLITRWEVAEELSVDHSTVIQHLKQIVNVKKLHKWVPHVKVAQSCLTLCDSMDYTVHGVLQARTLEWVAFPFSRGSSQSRDWTQISRTAGGFFISWVTREDLGASWGDLKSKKLSFWSVVFKSAMKSRFYTTTSDDQLNSWAEKTLQSTSQSQTCTKKMSWSLFGGLLPV